MRTGERLRYGRPGTFPPHLATVDGMSNWWAATRPPDGSGLKVVKLDAGINAPAAIDGPEGRVPFLAIRSSPHKVGTEVTPWEDVHRPDQGYVRYFGDSKHGGTAEADATLGNRRMVTAWRQHVDGDKASRLRAPPILVFEAFPFARRAKGQVIFHEDVPVVVEVR